MPPLIPSARAFCLYAISGLFLLSSLARSAEDPGLRNAIGAAFVATRPRILYAIPYLAAVRRITCRNGLTISRVVATDMSAQHVPMPMITPHARTYGGEMPSHWANELPAEAPKEPPQINVNMYKTALDISPPITNAAIQPSDVTLSVRFANRNDGMTALTRDTTIVMRSMTFTHCSTGANCDPRFPLFLVILGACPGSRAAERYSCDLS